DPLEAIAAVKHSLYPWLVVQVPVDRLRQAALEGVARLPAQFTAQLAGVDRVAAIVARPVGDEGDLRLVRLAIRARTTLVEQRADGLYHLDVLLLRIAADVIGLADPAVGQHGADRIAVVADEQPVAYLTAVAVDRQRLAGQRLRDYQRDELLRKVVGPIVVRAGGGQHRQAVGVVERAHQMVGRSFRRRIRRIGSV